MEAYGNISVNLAKAVTIPGAPWQKWTNLTLVDPADVEKLPLMRCLKRNWIEARIYIKNWLIFGPKLLYLMEVRIIFKFPPRPWAAPKY